MNLLNELLRRKIRELQESKWKIVYDKLKEKTGISIDEDLESKKRFKSIVCESFENGYETYYYNDGSIEGLLLITFLPINIKNEGLSINVSNEYY